MEIHGITPTPIAPQGAIRLEPPRFAQTETESALQIVRLNGTNETPVAEVQSVIFNIPSTSMLYADDKQKYFR